MIKKIDRYYLTSSINYKYIVEVRPFFSTKTVDMLDYIKPMQRDFNHDIYILHVGTNNLSSCKSQEQISILNLVKFLNLNSDTVVVLKKKADEVSVNSDN